MKPRSRAPSHKADAFAEYYRPEHMPDIVEGHTLDEDQTNDLRNALNGLAIVWAASASLDARNQARPKANEEWKEYIGRDLASLYEQTFGAKPSANVTSAAVVDGPFVRFVITALRPINQNISGEAIREILREYRGGR
jgi:hypothetical protein